MRPFRCSFSCSPCASCAQLMPRPFPGAWWVSMTAIPSLCSMPRNARSRSGLPKSTRRKAPSPMDRGPSRHFRISCSARTSWSMSRISIGTVARWAGSRCGGTDVNAALVAAGAAWVYRQYAKDPRLFALEAEARAAQRGLWALPEAQRTPPWEWRREKREGGTQAARAGRPAAAPPAHTTGFSCDGKTTCSQMTSCGEAQYHLRQCGNSRLDRDGDGIPCEAICR